MPLIAGMVTVVVAFLVVLLGFFVGPRWFVSVVLDRDAAEQGVAKILREQDNTQHISDVQCPETMPVEPGRVYTCTVRVEGHDKSVTLTITDNVPHYEVGPVH